MTPQQRIYLDNAATSFPKPPEVAQAVADYMNQVGASAGRGAYREAVQAGRMLEAARAAIRKLFNASPADAVIFTHNGTDALNFALKGLVADGAHVVTTCMDHNSVLRPLSALQRQRGVSWNAVDASETTHVDPRDVRRAIRPTTALVAVNHASNVTGALQPISEIGAVCREHGVPFLIDAAQSAGHLPIDFAALPVDMIAVPGHKGLLGPLGTGVLLIRAGLDKKMRSVREGGTGSVSEVAEQPDAVPDKFESGSHNAPGIAGLLAGVQWLLERDISRHRAHEVELMREFVAALDDVPGLAWFGPRALQDRVPVFSVRLEGVDPTELATLLEQQFGILTRAGLHCAPLAHRSIGTDQTGGTTRLSFGHFNTLDHARSAAAALRDLARALCAA